MVTADRYCENMLTMTRKAGLARNNQGQSIDLHSYFYILTPERRLPKKLFPWVVGVWNSSSLSIPSNLALTAYHHFRNLDNSQQGKKMVLVKELKMSSKTIHKVCLYPTILLPKRIYALLEIWDKCIGCIFLLTIFFSKTRKRISFFLCKHSLLIVWVHVLVKQISRTFSCLNVL